MSFFSQELAIDLGTANTVILKDDQVVLDEPSIIAVETKTGKLAGGGALLRGLAQRFTDRVHIRFQVAEDPLKAVARGTCLALKMTGEKPFWV